MTGSSALRLRRADIHTAEALLRRLSTLWIVPRLAAVPVSLNRRLSRTLGRVIGSPWRIELGPQALGSSERLREIVTHEGAHAALATGVGPMRRQAPHGPEWRELMALAGYPNATAAHWRCRTSARRSARQGRRPKPDAILATRYEHWCPVCQSNRVGRRPVKAWRCTACVAIGLDGTLEITRRTARPATAR